MSTLTHTAEAIKLLEDQGLMVVPVKMTSEQMARAKKVWDALPPGCGHAVMFDAIYTAFVDARMFTDG